MERPRATMKLLQEALQMAQIKVIDENARDTQERPLQRKELVRIRLSNLPYIIGETFYVMIPSVGAMGKLISLSGTVVRVGSPRMIESSGKYECVRCKCVYEMQADMTQYATIPKPDICTAIIDGQECRTAKFTKALFKGGCEDYQEVKIQESSNNLQIGAVPKSLTVILRDSLVDCLRAGDNVQIVGVLQSRWKALKSNSKADLELFFEANNIIKMSADLQSLEVSINFTAHINEFWSKQTSGLNGRSVIVKSFCPQIHGMFLPKLAVLLILVGGCSSDEYDSEESEQEKDTIVGSRRHRREGHILLVGDPGTAKSQILMSAARLSNRAVLTTGSGSTNAGLTCTAVKDGGDWTLEAGALVLADKGICCIDEFNCLRPADRASIHEAMEQQTLSVAKAGLVCKLKTRCSVIAACNSKGKFEEGESISSNTALASPLLSRFDLILVLLDRRSTEWDTRLSRSILDAACEQRSAGLASTDAVWDNEMLKAYISYTKQKGQPKMSFPARIIISKYYQLQRSASGRDTARTTVRLLESLIRLSQAHAKLLWQAEIFAHDAIAAIILMESSLQTQAILGVRPDLYAEAPDDPVAYHEELSGQILSRLQINPAVFEDAADVEPLQDLLSESAELDEILCSWAPTQMVMHKATKLPHQFFLYLWFLVAAAKELVAVKVDLSNVQLWQHTMTNELMLASTNYNGHIILLKPDGSLLKQVDHPNIVEYARFGDPLGNLQLIVIFAILKRHLPNLDGAYLRQSLLSLEEEKLSFLPQIFRDMVEDAETICNFMESQQRGVLRRSLESLARALGQSRFAKTLPCKFLFAQVNGNITGFSDHTHLGTDDILAVMKVADGGVVMRVELGQPAIVTRKLYRDKDFVEIGTLLYIYRDI